MIIIILAIWKCYGKQEKDNEIQVDLYRISYDGIYIIDQEISCVRSSLISGLSTVTITRDNIVEIQDVGTYNGLTDVVSHL